MRGLARLGCLAFVNKLGKRLERQQRKGNGSSGGIIAKVGNPGLL